MPKKTGPIVIAALALLALGAGVVLWGRLGEKSAAVPSAAKNVTGHSAAKGSHEDTFAFDEDAKNAPPSAASKAEHESATSLDKVVEPLRGNVVVSFGKVEDIGRQAGYILPLLSEMRSLSSGDPTRLSAEQRGHLLDLQRRYADLLGVLPEIAGFQNNPAEYGKFFANMARQSAGLSEPQAAQVDGFMRARANEMIQSGLNDANKPADPSQLDAWEARRDQFNEQTVEGLRQVLSPQVADRAGINEQLMEFLETDFDKAQKQPVLN